MNIKTLAEILAESDTDSASHAYSTQKTPKKTAENKPKSKPHLSQSKMGKSKMGKSKMDSPSTFSSSYTNSDDSLPPISNTSPSKKRQKHFHPAARFHIEQNNTPAYTPPESQSIKQILAEIKDGSAIKEDNGTDTLPIALKAYLRTPEQKQAERDEIKAESRLRWLAFYYLSRREHSQAELKQKLLDKEQDPDKIDALLDEFAEKGYQSDYRTTLMLIREGIRKGRGRGHIKQTFYKKKMTPPSNIDELIDMANTESDEFNEFVEDTESLVDGVDWLKLAVIARTKKYGNNVPTEQKEKAKQLRFLQYRGFKSDICFAALDYTLETLEERF